MIGELPPAPDSLAGRRCQRCRRYLDWGSIELGIMVNGVLTATRRLCRPCANEALEGLGAALKPPRARETLL